MQERKNGVHAPEKEQRKKRPLWQKIAFGTGIALVAAIVLGVGYVNGKLDLIHYHDGSVDEVGSIGAEEDQDLDGTGLSVADGEMEMPEGSPFSDSDVLNILLIGTDERTEAVNDWDAFTHLNELDGTADTTEFSENARADTLILVSLNIREHTIKLVSIERGTGVPILLPEYEGQYDWITHTFRYGGARLTMETVEDCFNVKVDHYVRVNFNSFVQIVDAVGGIDIKLTELEAKALNWEVPSNSMLIVNKVHQGWNHFDGYTALQYARLRKIDNDWKRIERQRTVIQAVLDAVKSASVTELNDLLNTVLPLVQTDFTKTEIAALLIQVPGFLGAQAEQMSLPVEGSYGVRYGMDNRLMYDPDWTMNIRALHDFLYGENSDSDTYPLGEPEQTPETARPEPTPEPVETMEPEEYLAQNSAAVTLGYPLSAGTLGEGGAALYLNAEQPGWAENWQVRRTLLQYLHENEDVTCMLADVGAGAGILLDDYINGGDEENLRFYLTRCGAGEEEEAFWRWLAGYNARQQEADKLHVFGLNADEDTLLALEAMALLTDAEKTPEDSVAAVVRRITAKGNIRRSAAYFSDTAAAFGEAMEQNGAALEKYFGVTWPLAEQLYQNWKYMLASDGDANTVRAQNFRFAYDWYVEECFYLQADSALVLPDTADGTQNFGSWLCGGDSPVQGQVCTILTAYFSTGSQGEDAFREIWPDSRLLDYDLLRENAAGGLWQDTVVNLDGEESPFRTESLLLKDGNGPDTATVQKLVLVADPHPDSLQQEKASG